MFLGYFVFEPVLVIIRFALLPLCIKTLRPEWDETDETNEELVVVDGEAQAENEEEVPAKRSVFTYLCCCLSIRTIKVLQRRAEDVLLTILDAVT